MNLSVCGTHSILRKRLPYTQEPDTTLITYTWWRSSYFGLGHPQDVPTIAVQLYLLLQINPLC